MEVEVVSALVGTLVGATATVAMAWINQKTLNHGELIRDEMRTRRALYGEFITEFARLLELRQLARSGEADALKAFGEACRAEYKSIQARL